MADVIIIGAGPAGVVAALRAADLGARTTLVTRQEFGGMAANDGPVPVRTLAHAARLLREARQLGRYGIAVERAGAGLSAPARARARGRRRRARALGAARAARRSLGVTVHEQAGRRPLRRPPHASRRESGLRLEADKIILCTGGTSRRLAVPGFELTATHSDAWSLTAVPPSMLVDRRRRDRACRSPRSSTPSARGCSSSRPARASCRPRTRTCRPPSRPPSARRASRCARASAPSSASRRRRAACGWSSRRTACGSSAEAALAVVAVGWVADTAGLDLATAGVETDARGFVRVDA